MISPTTTVKRYLEEALEIWTDEQFDIFGEKGGDGAQEVLEIAKMLQEEDHERAFQKALKEKI
jgi:hypothetical protein